MGEEPTAVEGGKGRGRCVSSLLDESCPEIITFGFPKTRFVRYRTVKIPGTVSLSPGSCCFSFTSVCRKHKKAGSHVLLSRDPMTIAWGLLPGRCGPSPPYTSCWGVWGLHRHSESL
jgi:hypothetical protein